MQLPVPDPTTDAAVDFVDHHLADLCCDTPAPSGAFRGGQSAADAALVALDVTDPEPLPPDHPLLTLPNLIVLPHVGSATLEARSAMTEIAVANVEAGLAGRPLPHPATYSPPPCRAWPSSMSGPTRPAC